MIILIFIWSVPLGESNWDKHQARVCICVRLALSLSIFLSLSLRVFGGVFFFLVCTQKYQTFAKKYIYIYWYNNNLIICFLVLFVTECFDASMWIQALASLTAVDSISKRYVPNTCQPYLFDFVCMYIDVLCIRYFIGRYTRFCVGWFGYLQPLFSFLFCFCWIENDEKNNKQTNERNVSNLSAYRYKPLYNASTGVKTILTLKCYTNSIEEYLETCDCFRFLPICFFNFHPLAKALHN